MAYCPACCSTGVQLGGGSMPEPCRSCKKQEYEENRQDVIDRGKFGPLPIQVQAAPIRRIIVEPIQVVIIKKHWFKRILNVFLPHRNEIGWLRGSIKWLFRL